MKKIIIPILITIFLLGLTSAQVVIFNPIDDTYDAQIMYKDGAFVSLATDKTNVGTKKAEFYSGYLQFDTTSIPDDATINSATLTIYNLNVLNDDACNIYLENISDWYPIDETDWLLTGNLISTTPIFSFIKSQYYDFSVDNVNVLGTTNYKLSSDPFAVDANCLVELGDTGAQRASLTIDYDVPFTWSYDNSIVSIENVYWSEQVLQGGYTEIFALVNTNGTDPIVNLKLDYPDSTTRTIRMSPTINDNEYRGFITDTYDVGIVTFSISATMNNYRADYGNQYQVAAYNVDFVDVVNQVKEVAVCQQLNESEMDIFGTEYIAGDYGRVFLQLKDGQGLPENHGSCYIKVYYPPHINDTAELFIDNGAMLYLDGSDGLYYYDVGTMPNIPGVYMMTAGCNAELSSAFAYYTDGTDAYGPMRTSIIGTHSSSTITLNGFNDYAYTSCAATGGATKSCQSTYLYDLNIHFSENATFNDLSLFYMGEASINALLVFDVWNYTSSSWITLPNTLTYSGHAASGPTGLNDFVSNYIPGPTDVIGPNRTMLIRTTATSGTTFQEYKNWLNINLKTSSGVVQELKGSGELHISNAYQQLTDQHNILNNSIINTNETLHIHLDEVNYTINQNINSTNTTLHNKLDSVNYTINQNINSTNTTLHNRVNEINVSLTGQINEVASEVWGWTGLINSNILSQVTSEVWSYVGRYVHGTIN